MRNRKITIVGYLGYDNLGDDLMLDCLIENIQKSYPKLEIDVLTKETENIKSIVKKHKNINIYFFKNNNKLGNLKLYLKSILGSKLTIWSGGTCFSDEDGVGNFLYFFINMLLLRKFAYVGIGIGNLTNKNSIFKSKLLLNRMAFASFRDKKSFEKASLLSKNNNIYLTSDLSYIFDINKYKIKVEKPYVLVSLRDLTSYYTKDSLIARKESVIKFIEKIIEDDGKLKIFFLPIDSIKDYNVNRNVYDRLIKKHKNSDITFFENPSFESKIELIAGAELNISERLHSMVLSKLYNKKCLALSYSPKIDRFFTEINDQNYFSHVEVITYEKLVEMHENVRNSEFADLAEILSVKKALAYKNVSILKQYL
ncbi:hypothetical protein D1815_16860 [Aquimarina sp. AD1]|uniref:polysaccharide pyruvyl transferase family protein n=1 Tax=Aquimarina sp. (strain AD1) TaxID=1714848 RepID=UPI000E5578D6|nr:polysaccharide pyruvyl transferase family protein [Aquimarina sp. AD1]AXT57332.1 hypothetical protein D1815_16860 [Aquimarina sp. AD1]